LAPDMNLGVDDLHGVSSFSFAGGASLQWRVLVFSARCGLSRLLVIWSETTKSREGAAARQRM
ncbi:MAG TPA: hypothetical protein VK634_19835, partial [Reyranella sp.]|nr:hypothetical protein [Reyranella sp.]